MGNLFYLLINYSYISFWYIVAKVANFWSFNQVILQNNAKNLGSILVFNWFWIPLVCLTVDSTLLLICFQYSSHACLFNFKFFIGFYTDFKCHSTFPMGNHYRHIAKTIYNLKSSLHTPQQSIKVIIGLKLFSRLVYGIYLR